MKIKRNNFLLSSGVPIQKRICVAIPLTGTVRVEWMMARYGQTIPVNWSNADFVQYVDTFSPLSYAVDDARNISVDFAVRNNFEWVFFLDHDVILPNNTFVKLNPYMIDGTLPVVCGLYNAKGFPPEPLVFRGRGNSVYTKWKPGEKVMVDAVPMGCTLLSVKLLKAMWEVSPAYTVRGQSVRKVFVTPRVTEVNDEGQFCQMAGTEDFYWCDRVLKEGWLKRTGYTKAAKMKYPFLCDTSIKCGHIDNDGRIF